MGMQHEEMITEDRLKGAYSEGEALAIYREARSENLAVVCRTFMYNADYQVVRNMLWALTKASDSEHRQLQPLLHPLIDLSMQTGNSSVRRLALNNILRLEMAEADLRTDFLNFCLTHMAAPDEYPGIQSLCMKLAYRMSGFYPELMDELKRTVAMMDMSYYKPAVRSVRNRLLAGKKV